MCSDVCIFYGHSSRKWISLSSSVSVTHRAQNCILLVSVFAAQEVRNTQLKAAIHISTIPQEDRSPATRQSPCHSGFWDQSEGREGTTGKRPAQ